MTQIYVIDPQVSRYSDALNTSSTKDRQRETLNGECLFCFIILFHI